MLILVGPTNWGNPVVLILSTSSSSSHIHNIDTQPGHRRGSASDSPTLANRRKAPHQKDNPFSVIYEPNSSHHTENLRPNELPSPSYRHIEKELQAGRSPARSGFSTHKPTVTVIDETNLRRAGSVLSRSLSTMRHGTIRRRKRMAKRSEITSPSPSVYSTESVKTKTKSRASKWAFMFPTKTRRPFKYTPISKAQRKPYFESQQEIDDFYWLDGIAAVVREMLPRTMLTFKYKKLTKIFPELRLHPERFTVTRNNSFHIIDSNTAKGPLQATKEAPPIEKEAIRRYGESSKASAVFARRQMFLSTVYKEYREKVLWGKFLLPPKFDLLLPFEAGIMKPEEKASMDVKILLEVLLRRTVAAKIEFRLAQSGLGSSSRSSTYSGDFSLSSKYSESDNSSTDTSKKHSTKKRNTSTGSGASYVSNQESAASHNPLPSPQISSVSQFEEAYNLLGISKELSQRLIRYIPSLHQEPGTSLFAKSPSGGKRHTPSPTSVFKSPLYSAAPPKSKPQAETRNASFNNFKFASPLSDVGSLSNMNMYSLQPMNRSVTTISTRLESNSDSLPRSVGRSIASLPDEATSKPRGQSNSTTNTSVMHSVDDLSKRVTNSQEYTLEISYMSPTATLAQLESPSP